MFFKTAMIGSGVAAGLCVLALPLWVLGVPGTENNYAKGWKMGLGVITTYPAAWLVNFAAFWGIKSRLDKESILQLETISGTIALVLMVVALIRLIWSFKVMS